MLVKLDNLITRVSDRCPQDVLRSTKYVTGETSRETTASAREPRPTPKVWVVLGHSGDGVLLTQCSLVEALRWDEALCSAGALF